jgi:hypothetical protein
MARAARKGHGFDCGCSGLGHFVGSLPCECGYFVAVDAWMPTSARVGEARQMGTACPLCDGDAEGWVQVVEVEGAH